MNPEVKTKWLAALRSGKYRQGKYWFRSRDGRYCAFGVLVHSCGFGRWTGGPRESLFGWEPAESGEGDPLKAVCEFAGITSTQLSEVATRNDRGESFEEIADFVEANL